MTKDEIRGEIVNAARRYGIPPQLALAQAKAESNYDATAVSSAGAVGVMQIIPSTAVYLGISNLYDPMENIDGGMRYLREQYDRFKDWGLALAAYNAGPGNVSKYGGIPPFRETQNYVEKILSSITLDSESEGVVADNMGTITKVLGFSVIGLGLWVLLKG